MSREANPARLINNKVKTDLILLPMSLPPNPAEIDGRFQDFGPPISVCRTRGH